MVRKNPMAVPRARLVWRPADVADETTSNRAVAVPPVERSQKEPGGRI